MPYKSKRVPDTKLELGKIYRDDTAAVTALKFALASIVTVVELSSATEVTEAILFVEDK